MPNYEARTLLITALAFGVYYLGIYIRKKVYPGRRSLPLSKQFLLGIPISLVIVPTMAPVIEKTIGNLATVLLTLGLIMEQGMVLNETAASKLHDILKQARQQGGGQRED